MADKKEDKKEERGPKDIPEVIATHIASVMRDRKNMKYMENELDRFLATMSDEEKSMKKAEMRNQLIDGRLVLESILQRLLTSTMG